MPDPSPSPARAIVLHPDDDVAVLVEPAQAGARIDITGRPGAPLVARRALPLGHKIALRALGPGAPVRKYGEIIGTLTAPVAPGDHVHVHNLTSRRAS